MKTLKTDGIILYGRSCSIAREGEILMVKHITVHITSTCNLNCEFCHVAAKFNNNEEEPLDVQMLDNLFTPSVESISIAGGEPFFVKKKLYEFLNYIPDSIKDIAITTNGLLISEEDIEMLKMKRIRLQMSLDGMDIYHEKNRGENTYGKSIDSLKKAVNAGIRVDALTTVSNDNIEHISKFIKSIDDLGIENLTLLHFTPKGRGSFRPELEVPYDEWIRLIARLRKELNDVNTRIWIQPRYLTRNTIEMLDKSRSIHLCNCFTFKYAYVNVCDGSVYPCGLAYDTPLKVGSIKTNSLQYLANEAVKNTTVPKECSCCDAVDICKGGAKCYGLLGSGSVDKRDSHCKGGKVIPICPFPAMYIAGPKMKTNKPTIV